MTAPATRQALAADLRRRIRQALCDAIEHELPPWEAAQVAAGVVGELERAAAGSWPVADPWGCLARVMEIVERLKRGIESQGGERR